MGRIRETNKGWFGALRGSKSWEPQHQKLKKGSYTDRTTHPEQGVCGSHVLALTGSSHWPSPTVNPGKGFPGTEEGESGSSGIQVTTQQ